VRGDAAQTDSLGADERRQGAQGLDESRHDRVRLEALGRNPRLEVHVTHLELALGAMGLGVDAADQPAVVQDRQRVVAVHALGRRRVDLDAIGEAEEPGHTVAIPEQ